jgi:hypothetical protein
MFMDGEMVVMDRTPVQDQPVMIHHVGSGNDPRVVHDSAVTDRPGAVDDLAGVQIACAVGASGVALVRMGRR